MIHVTIRSMRDTGVDNTTRHADDMSKPECVQVAVVWVYGNGAKFTPKQKMGNPAWIIGPVTKHGRIIDYIKARAL